MGFDRASNRSPRMVKFRFMIDKMYERDKRPMNSMMWRKFKMEGKKCTFIQYNRGNRYG